MFEVFTKYKKYTDYIPMILIAVLFMAENEIENHTFHSTCNMFIGALTLFIFFVIGLKLKSGKMYGFLFALIIWVTLVYLKNCYFPRN